MLPCGLLPTIPGLLERRKSVLDPMNKQTLLGLACLYGFRARQKILPCETLAKGNFFTDSIVLEQHAILGWDSSEIAFLLLVEIISENCASPTLFETFSSFEFKLF